MLGFAPQFSFNAWYFTKRPVYLAESLFNNLFLLLELHIFTALSLFLGNSKNISCHLC